MKTKPRKSTTKAHGRQSRKPVQQFAPGQAVPTELNTQTSLANPDDTKGGKMAFLYEKITQAILAQLEKGVKPWEAQYTKTGWAFPRNYISNRCYTSINLLLLATLPYEQPYYLTKNQINGLGGRIRKGESGHIVTFWKFPDEITKDKFVADGKRVAPLFRFNYVWNVAQTEGITFNFPDWTAVKDKNRQLQIHELQTVVDRMTADGIRLSHLCPEFPNYNVRQDLIQIPPISDFRTPENYYKTLFHEIVHATGHPQRLNREYVAAPLTGGRRTGEGRVFEELTAEIGTSFVLNALGIDFEQRTDLMQNAAAYVDSFIGLLKNDRTLIVKAASRAQAAANYILNGINENELKNEPNE